MSERLNAHCGCLWRPGAVTQALAQPSEDGINDVIQLLADPRGHGGAQ